MESFRYLGIMYLYKLCTVYVTYVLVHTCSLLLGNPVFKGPYLEAYVVDDVARPATDYNIIFILSIQQIKEERENLQQHMDEMKQRVSL